MKNEPATDPGIPLSLNIAASTPHDLGGVGGQQVAEVVQGTVAVGVVRASRPGGIRVLVNASFGGLRLPR